MESHEIAETISEASEHGHAAPHHVSDETFRRRTGVFIGLLACALAITATGGSSAMKRTINENITVSDTYAYYQAKTLRQQVLQTGSDDMEALLAAVPGAPAEAATAIRQKQEAYKKSIAHWESAPETGDGRKELQAKAKAAEARRDAAAEANEWFELAEALLQIAVVLASTSILTASRPLLLFSGSLALVGVFGTVNGFFPLIELPFGH